MHSKFFGVLGKTDYFNFNLERIPLHEVLDKYLQPSGWLATITHHQQVIPPDKPTIFESGAWGYREQETPIIRGKTVTAEFALEEYKKRCPKPGDLILAPDHLLLNNNNIKSRVQFNERSSQTFLPLALKVLPKCTPAAVVHGKSVKDKVQRAQELYAQGYRVIAVGGLVPLSNYKSLVFETVKAIRTSLPTDCYCHVLGLSSPPFAQFWSQLSIDSFDGSSYIQNALKANEFLVATGHKLLRYPAVSCGQRPSAPQCYCPVCARLFKEGFDPRTTGSRQANLGRVAHNLGQTLIAQFAAVMPRQVALVSCVSKKLTHPAPAKDLYCSSWWQLAKKYTETSRLDWRPLSARHGLLHPEQILAPYEESLNNKSKEQRIAWSQKVVEQLLELAPAGGTFVFIGGEKYREFVIPFLHNTPKEKKYLTLAPMAGLGIGRQKQWLKEMAPQCVQLSIL